MLDEKIKEEGLDCCIDEVGEMMQGLIRTLHMFERIQITNKGFTNSQCYTLLNIYKDGPFSMNELSEEMNLDTSTMTRIVNNLVRDNYIKREKSEKDRRIVLVNLTDKGNQVAKELYQEVIKFYRQIINKLPEGKVIDVVKAMDNLINAFEEVKPYCC
jgi:DNA-binding MarR family transcriptional regulator